ncbi:hypothetical protein OROMI_004269 [Orobanche minor]
MASGDGEKILSNSKASRENLSLKSLLEAIKSDLMAESTHLPTVLLLIPKPVATLLIVLLFIYSRDDNKFPKIEKSFADKCRTSLELPSTCLDVVCRQCSFQGLIGQLDSSPQ